MCLDSKMIVKERKEVTDEIGDDGISVYKVVGIDDEGYYPPVKYTKTPYANGINEAVKTQLNISHKHRDHYQTGFHFYMTREIACQYLKYMEYLVADHHNSVLEQSEKDGERFHLKYKVIECKVKKSWITMVGRKVSRQWGQPEVVIVAKKAIFPKFEKEEICV